MYIPRAELVEISEDIAKSLNKFEIFCHSKKEFMSKEEISSIIYNRLEDRFLIEPSAQLI